MNEATLRLWAAVDARQLGCGGICVNKADTEIRIMNGQCLDRRLDGQSAIAKEVASWEARQNARGARIHWTFTLAAAC